MTNKLNEGVGKKIVEALKKQSEEVIEKETEQSIGGIDGLIPNIEETINQETSIDSPVELSDNDNSSIVEEITISENKTQEDIIKETVEESKDIQPIEIAEDLTQETIFENTSFADTNINTMFWDNPKEESDNFKPFNVSNNIEIPSNIAILKKLISQLPSGVTRHTGAQIIKQTMEALGISMKSVLKEAQEAQENLKESARECQVNIQEYKRKISELEQQSQNYQKQYNALNDLISLFIQTTK